MLATRALGFNLVFIYHCGFLSFGFMGVDIFFVISGYVIFKSLQKVSSTCVWFDTIFSFTYNRLFKIYPALIFVIGSVLALSYLVIPAGDRIEVYKFGLTSILGISNIYQIFAQNYFSPASVFNPFTHLWSVSMELQFYLFALFVFLFVKFSKLFYAILIFFFFASLFLFIFGDRDVLYLDPRARIWAFILGMLIAAFALDVRKKVIVNFIFFVLVSLIAYYFYQKSGTEWRLVSIFGVTIAYAFVACDLVFGRKLPERLYFWVSIQGRLSYSLYLVHFPIISFFYWIWGPLEIEHVLILYLGSHLTAVALFQVIERPLNFKVRLTARLPRTYVPL